MATDRGQADIVTAAVLGSLRDPRMAEVQVGDAAAGLLGLVLYVASLAPDPDAVIERLDQTWMLMIAPHRRGR